MKPNKYSHQPSSHQRSDASHLTNPLEEPTHSKGQLSTTATVSSADRLARITSEDIARRAYFHYLSHGAGDGRDVEDWLAAEVELRGDGKPAAMLIR